MSSRHDNHRVFEARVRGRVQGVGFRWATQQAAREHKVCGWVKNEADGSVRLHAKGDEAALEALRRFLHSGPPGAAVEDVAWDEIPALHGSDDFVIQR